jgi:hypothetical protein
MKLRRKLALMFSVAGCAFALMFPAPMPGLDMIEMRAPQHIDFLAGAENTADSEAMMVAIRERAKAALAQLQTAAAKNL